MLRHIIISAAVILLSALPAHAELDIGLQNGPTYGRPQIAFEPAAVPFLRAALGIAGFFLLLGIIWGCFLLSMHNGNVDRRVHAEEILKKSFFGLMAVVVTSALTKVLVGAFFKVSENIS